jgi:hypothetical protein
MRAKFHNLIKTAVCVTISYEVSFLLQMRVHVCQFRHTSKNKTVLCVYQYISVNEDHNTYVHKFTSQYKVYTRFTRWAWRHDKKMAP